MAIIEVKVIKEYEVKFLKVSAGVRYWEDATVNGEDDDEGTLIPCREGDIWAPLIDVDTGKITNWKQGTTANVHYKVCDAGVYTLQGTQNETVLEIDGYVPGTMCPGGCGYGDYIIMNIDEDGYIENWVFHGKDFQSED